MKKLICLGCAAALVALSGVVASSARADDEKAPTIKKVMSLHKGAKAPLGLLKAELKSESPDWASVQKLTKQFDTLGAGLPKTEAPKGDQESYVKLAKAYASAAHDLDAAAKKEDKAGANAALGKIGTSCMSCHKAHKP